MSTRKNLKMIASGFLFTSALIATVATTFGPLITAQGQTQPQTCGVHTLHGLYLFATHGWNIVNGVAQPKAIVERIDFNGDGTLASPFATVSINGNIVRSTGATGLYAVNSDCTGTLTFTSGPTFDIFVDHRGGKQLWMIQTAPALPGSPPTGPVFEGIAVRVSP